MGYGFRCGCLSLLAATGAVVPPADITGLVRAEGIDPAASALLVIRLDDGQAWESNPGRIGQRFVPASTSKIPHTLIALETGYADGPGAAFEWDGTERWFDAWNRDQTLESAYRVSAVWVYQQIAAELGRDTMSTWLTRFDYGNHDTGGPDDLTTYWLDGPLEISAREQAAFLARLARDELPLHPATFAAARAVMQADRGPGWTLYAKTGWGVRPGADDLGWYVGWVEREDGPDWVFAFNLDMPDADSRNRRIPVVRAVLDALGAIPTHNDEEQ